MIGVRLGASAAQGGEGAGLFVIDLDPKEGDAGALLDLLRLKCAEFKAWADELGPAATLELSTSYALPPCPVTVTPRGGLHLWFRYPAAETLPGGKPIGNRMNILAGYADQIDVRSNDGYVIIPPSVRAGQKAAEEGCDGTAYKWLEGASFSDLCGVPEAPPEVLRLVLERHREAGEARAQANEGPAGRPAPQSFAPIPPRAAATGADPRSGAIAKFIAAAFAGEVNKVATAREGGRNVALNNAALSLGHHVGAGALTEGEVRSALLSAAEQNGMIADDGLRAAEMTLASGLSAGVSDPATYDHVGRRAGLSNRPPPIMDIDDRCARASLTPFGKAMGGEADGCEYPEPEDAEAWKAWHGEPPGRSDGDMPPPPHGIGEGADDEPVDPEAGEKLAFCCAQELNDVGNGQRLIRRFGDRFLNVDIAENPTTGFGLHAWVGTHWDQVTGHRSVQRFAHKTARRIKSEAEFLEMTKVERTAVERGDRAKLKPKAEQTDEDRDAIQLGEDAKKLFTARKTARAKFSVSSGNGLTGPHWVVRLQC